MPRLSAERWRQLIPHLDRGLELAEAERGPWLAAVQATDPGLAADLEELLSTHRRLDEEAFLRDPLADAGSRPSLAGQRCGAYTLLSPIGQGGMGSVWLAERTDGRFQGQAAVKLLNASLVGRDADARSARSRRGVPWAFASARDRDTR